MTDTKALFAHTWAEAVADAEKRSPNYTVDQFTPTGRAGKEYGGKRNHQWWLDHGHEMVDKWIAWRTETGWQLWEYQPNQPAIEMELLFTLPGDIPIKAYIDRVFVLPTGELAVVDLKTGRSPETGEQLGLYATGLELLGYPRPTWGYYWTPDKGHGSPINLDGYDATYFGNLFATTITGINNGVFIPKPANACGNWCGVRDWCAAVGGSKAHEVDSLTFVDIDNKKGSA